MERENESISPLKSAKPMKKRGSLVKFIFITASYIVVAAIVWMIAMQWKSDPNEQQVLSEKEVKTLVAKVSKLMILPTIEAELPQVAIINDAASLAKTQAFFADVKNGDSVLIYLKSQKAIIYRGADNKIVNVGPVISDNKSGVQPQAATQTQSQTSSVKTNNDTKGSE